ncbi:hypothetical protein H8959_022246 [Pygathrix nigripes]
MRASLRLWNLRNALENKMEGICLKRTRMGIVLDALQPQEEGLNRLTISKRVRSVAGVESGPQRALSSPTAAAGLLTMTPREEPQLPQPAPVTITATMSSEAETQQPPAALPRPPAPAPAPGAPDTKPGTNGQRRRERWPGRPHISGACGGVGGWGGGTGTRRSSQGRFWEQ